MDSDEIAHLVFYVNARKLREKITTENYKSVAQPFRSPLHNLADLVFFQTFKELTKGVKKVKLII
jgi:hypothetical protein